MAKNQEPDEFDVQDPVIEDEYDPDDGTKEIVNVSQSTVVFEIDGVKHKMRPGERRRIPATYATAHRIAGRDPVACAIELLTNKMVLPIDHPKCPSSFRKAAG